MVLPPLWLLGATRCAGSYTNILRAQITRKSDINFLPRHQMFWNNACGFLEHPCSEFDGAWHCDEYQTKLLFENCKHIGESFLLFRGICPVAEIRSKRQFISLQWHHNEHNGVSNHQHPNCLLNSLLRRMSKKTSKLRVTSRWLMDSPHKGPETRINVSIWWRHHVFYAFRLRRSHNNCSLAGCYGEWRAPASYFSPGA